MRADDAPGVQRPVQIIVPFKQNDAKSRLAPVLTPEERRLLAFAMLRDVLAVVSGYGEVTVLSLPGLKKEEIGVDVAISQSSLELNEAINAFIDAHAKHGWPSDILIVMADLALLTGDVVDGILNCEGDVVLCPGRGGGTNMLLTRSPRFRTCYIGLSFPKHCAQAKLLGLHLNIFESFRAGCDIDDPGDLAEAVLHGRGDAPCMLKKMGFELANEGKAELRRGASREFTSLCKL
ncbi:MAG: 2-phospho-L-lactate guanylyltransferase [Methanosaeta sp. PtaB.Bin018]|nr:2-phospho-L-lactate guanylyltransferase [Methanothrix sp.]OPX76166.1 MAG: 2-phospho-L-lactate guanylyltransferase [Methanosaeta sp. PtaB.Bin018]HOV51518.1 2-phospho-L-lactate guanylyltransferase [Methanothrix sp.]